MSDTAVLDLTIEDNGCVFGSYIAQAAETVHMELGQLDDTIASVERLQPDCDKLDYALAASCGALCGVIDIFCVGAPGDSKLQEPALQWMRHTTVTFAKLCGWDGEQSGIQSAVVFLATKFLADSDSPHARKLGLLFEEDADPENRDRAFRAFGRESSLFGIFFAILCEFTDTAPAGEAGKLHFVHDNGTGAGLHGNTPAEKIFCGIVNWLGYQLFSRDDAIGAMQQALPALGIPTPVWNMITQCAMHARDIPLPAPKFLERFQQLASQIYEQGYGIRFLAAQSVPVLLDEALTRLFYAARRLFAYTSSTDPSDFSAQGMWEACEPFSNATVQRMLTVAHGTFCLLDVTDAAIRGVVAGAGAFNVQEFVMRLNLVGAGRFAISLYGEGQRAVALRTAVPNAEFARRERTILEDYLDGLRELGRLYDDRHLVDFTEDFKRSVPYGRAFAKSVQLAQLRKVPEERILASKSDIDAYFNNSNK